MKVKVKFFAHFRELFGGAGRTVEARPDASILDLLRDICSTAEQKGEVFEEGSLHPHVVVMLNGTSIHSLRGPETELQEGDSVAVFPFLGGG